MRKEKQKKSPEINKSTSSLSPMTSSPTILLFLVLASTLLSAAEAFDPLDPFGNITIKWDIISWTPDGYVASVTIYNYQQYRHIEAPGWSLGWTWKGNEVIWAMMGARTTSQGDCFRFKGNNIPHSCQKSPIIVDLPPGTPYNQQVANCCTGGVISSQAQDPASAASSFQIAVGAAGNDNRTVRLPTNITLNAPGPGYTCGPAKIVRPSRFVTADGRRVTQAMMTWNVTCTYSQFLVQKTPTCCVSLSSFYNNTMVPCPKCSCGCRSNDLTSNTCLSPKSEHASSGKKPAPIVQCTNHMCPVRIHWHVKLNNKAYWQTKITVTNYNHNVNYSNWNLVAQVPNSGKLTQVSGFKHKPLTPYAGIKDVSMMWGVKNRNDLLMQAGPHGYVQGQLLFRKEKATSTFKKGWGFPSRIYFNGDSCVMPPPF